ncbi:MAG: hypothetical protein HY775_13450 [Acidobacteria bacterium]|nr:hypothetical protein [Acidobacteriota bacterium]
MNRRWVGCACFLVLISVLPAGASARRLDVRGNLWWSGTLRGPGHLRIMQTSARPVRTEGCFKFQRGGGRTTHLAGYSPSFLPHEPSPRGIESYWYAGGPYDVLVFCASEAPGRVALEVSGRWSGARWGQAGISLLREWDLSPTPVRGTFPPFKFRRGANAWVIADQGLLSIRTSRGTDYGLWEMFLDDAPPGAYSLGLEAGAGLVMLAAVDVAW